MVSLLGASGETKPVAFGKLKLVQGARDVPNAAYRLWLAAAGAGSGQKIVLDRVGELLAPVAAQRGFALAALRLHDAEGITRSGLSATEQAWLLMWLNHNTKTPQRAMECLAALPKEGYPDKLGVVAAHWRFWVDDPDQVDLVRAHVETFETTLADLLKLALDGDTGAVDRIRDHAASLTAPGVRLAGDHVSRLKVALSATSSDADGATLERAATAAAPAALRYAAIEGKWAGGTPVDPTLALTLSESVIDDLIDSGLLGSELVDAAEAVGHPSTQYLTARLRPENLDEEQLRECGHVEELARTAFLAGDDWRALFPEEHASRQRLELLDRLRSGTGGAAKDLIPLLPDRLRDVAASVGHSLETGEIDASALQDHSTWPVLATLLPGSDKLQQADPAIHRLHEWRSLHAATDALFQWDWSSAADCARDALRTADDEDVRDEALNLLACALYQQGNAEAAARALEDALQGLDSPDLIVNYGIVAAELDPEAASIELARLALEAPTLELRVTAARRALLLWGSHVPGEGEDDHPPESLVLAMRTLSVEPTGADEHTAIMKFLSWADDEWLADDRHTRASPYAAAAQHRYLVARAKGPKEGIDELAAIFRSNPGDQFVAEECDDLAETLIRLMLSEHRAIGAAVWGIALSDANLPLEPRQQLLVPVLAAREFALSMIDDEARDSTIKRELFDRVVNAKTLLPKLEDPEPFAELIDDAVLKIVVACWPGWAGELDAIVVAYNEVVGSIGSMYRRQVNKLAVRQFTDPMLTAIGDIERYVNAARSHLKDSELIGHLDDLRRHAAELKQSVLSLPR